ncbi:MAG: ferritin-like domain-containing protein [Thermorudis peleae]|nr:ferritin-like domain-containing protein [Thermorudis peleae]
MATNPVDLLNTVTNARVSRRTLFKGAGIAGAGLLMSRLGLFRSVLADSPESVKDIINIAATAESMAVTLLGGAIDSAKKGGYDKPIPDVVVAILDAARAEEEFHLEYLLSAGAQPLTQTFTVPDTSILSSYTKLFSTIVSLETAFIAAYIAAAREFAAMNQPELVKVAFQIAGTEAEHRVLANYALGTRPASDVAFEKALFTTVGQAAQTLQQLGYIGGSGPQVTYPGPGTINKANVTVTAPTGPSVSCSPAATPPAMPGITAPAQPKPGATYFKETGHNVSGAFLSYWQAFGGLAIFGYPLTEVMQENGLTVQYFERARFELHPGAAPQRYDVLLGLVGREVTAGRENEPPFRPLPQGNAPVWNGGMVPDSVEVVYFPQTGHYLGHGFLRYWQKFGGLEIFGFPISEEFREQNPDNGKTYVVQYFERARLEWHPGEWPERWDIMLGRLGAQVLNKRYGVPYP